MASEVARDRWTTAPLGDRLSSPFDAFDRIFCINLDRRGDRWAAVQGEFDRLGIRDRIERVSGQDASIGAEGCLRSHQTCVDLARQSGARSALIFEDDVRFMTSVNERLAPALLALAGCSWELFYLSGQIESRPRIVSRHLIQVPMFQTHAYAIHASAFDRVSEATVPIDAWYAKHLVSFATREPLAVQAIGVSDVENRVIDHSSYLMRNYRLYVESSPPMFAVKHAYYELRHSVAVRWRKASRGKAHVARDAR